MIINLGLFILIIVIPFHTMILVAEINGHGAYHRDRRRSIIHDRVHESVSDARQPILLFIVALNGNGSGLEAKGR